MRLDKINIKCEWSEEDSAFIAEHPYGFKTHGSSPEEAIEQMKNLISLIEEIESSLLNKDTSSRSY
jgi:predicted RNase H-like HicB family nuclease